MMAQEEYLRDRIEAALGKYLVPSIAKHTKLAFAKHRNDAGVLGHITISGICRRNSGDRRMQER